MPIYINGVPYRNLEDQVKYLTEGYNDLSLIKTYVPVDASATNQLASKSYVDQSVTTVAAHYLTSDASGNNFPTKAALLAGPYYYGADLHDPDENDYAFVNADESHSNLPSRYAYINDAWQYQYSLQASGGVVDLTSAQTITGVKTFDAGIVSSSIHSKTNEGLEFYRGNTIAMGFGASDVRIFDRNLYPRANNTNYSIGAENSQWKDIYMSGKLYIRNQYTYIDASNGTMTFNAINGTSRFNTFLQPTAPNTFDLGSSGLEWKDLYLSGNIIGSYKEANQIVTGSGGLRTAQFNMDAATVNKIKYLEIYMADGTQLYTHMLPVAAWNMSEWSTARTITTPMMNISVMYSSGVLYVAVPDSGEYEVQVFAKMI